MKIDTYSFGKMIIDGKEYTSDLIIYGGKVYENWWRKTSHKLFLDDIITFLPNVIEIVLMGTGKFGLMKVQKDLIDYCEKHAIELIVQKSEEAVETFNESVKDGKRILAAFHLTC